MLPYQTAESIEERIERELISLYQPGDLLPAERELAERYDTSRHLIRSALQRLANRGVITTRPGARSRLNSPAEATSTAARLLTHSRASIDEVYDARIVIEGGAVVTLASRVASGERSASDFAPLVAILDQIDQIKYGTHTRDRTGELDLLFHIGLTSETGSSVASGMLESTLALLRQHPMLWADDMAVGTWQLEHRRIIAHVRAGEALLAYEAIRSHIAGGQQRLKQLISAWDTTR